MHYPSTLDASDTSNMLPPPWPRIHHDCMERFHRAVGEDDRGCVLVELRDGLPLPTKSDDRVLDGIARKASEKMKVTCSSCGKGARQRKGAGRFWIQCAQCFGKAKLTEELKDLLESCPRSVKGPRIAELVVWHEHDLSARVR